MATILCELVAGMPNLEQETAVGTSLKLTWTGRGKTCCGRRDEILALWIWTNPNSEVNEGISDRALRTMRLEVRDPKHLKWRRTVEPNERGATFDRRRQV